MISKERIFEFISKQKTSFIASVDEEGFPNMKAMLAPRKIDGNRIYFTTNTSSLRVAQYRANPKASVYFYQQGPLPLRGRYADRHNGGAGGRGDKGGNLADGGHSVL